MLTATEASDTKDSLPLPLSSSRLQSCFPEPHLPVRVSEPAELSSLLSAKSYVVCGNDKQILGLSVRFGGFFGGYSAGRLFQSMTR